MPLLAPGYVEKKNHTFQCAHYVLQSEGELSRAAARWAMLREGHRFERNAVTHLTSTVFEMIVMKPAMSVRITMLSISMRSADGRLRSISSIIS